MKIFKFSLIALAFIVLTSCATGYTTINPQSLNYVSTHSSEGVKLEYKYDVLDKKYAKKEDKKAVRVVTVKITNNSDKDLVFGNDLVLTYENGNRVVPMDNTKVYKSLKQSEASYLLYLLLTPLNLSISGSSGDTTTIPIGLVLGPGIAAGNMIGAGSANKKFKTQLAEHNLNGVTIGKGETKYGMIGIKAESYEALQVKLVEDSEEKPVITE